MLHLVKFDYLYYGKSNYTFDHNFNLIFLYVINFLN